MKQSISVAANLTKQWGLLFGAMVLDAVFGTLPRFTSTALFATLVILAAKKYL